MLLVLSGFGLSIQGSINGALGRAIGSVQAALVSFVIGTICLFIVVMFMGKGNLYAVVDVPKWQLIGGMLGAIYISVLAFSVPRVGIGLALVCVVIGQIIMSMVIDHFGLFQSTQVLFNTPRLIGVLLLISGMICIYKGT
ncbi:DMT family transporter [Shimazuella soli]|uniref:DMT family transporter n=1 Tax=Shimazuella soli TaxID=1892854 RepID=UPI001F0FDB7E|nr:DMT family transporter [Shimazuella soli]